MSRTACVWVPQLELRARLAAEPELASEPVVLADVGSSRAAVLDASDAARDVGVHVGMSMVHARALCPEAVLVPPDPAFVRKIVDAILASLYLLGPVIGHDGREAFFVSLDGMTRLHPDEEVFASHLGDAARQQGLQAVVAIADRPLTAWIAAHAAPGCSGQTVRVPAGDDETFLAGLPVEAIPMPGEVTELCRVLGLSHAGDLQRLPPGALIRRFGRLGAELEQRVRARTADLFRVEVPAVIERGELELETPLDDLQPLLFLHKSVLDGVLGKVAVTGRSVAALEVTLVLADVQVDDGTHRAESVEHEGGRPLARRLFRPARPTLDGRAFLDLIMLWLSQSPLPGPVLAIRMGASEVSVATPRQLRLFEQQQDYSAEALSAAIARLVAAFGADAVVRPVLADRHRPEARIRWEVLQAAPDMWPPPGGEGSPRQPVRKRGTSASYTRNWRRRRGAPTPLTGTLDTGSRTSPDRRRPASRQADPSLRRELPPRMAPPAAAQALQIFDPPRPAELRGGWLRIGSQSRVRTIDDDARSLRVVELEGPYPLEGEWWDRGFRRDYFLVTTGDAQVIWLYQEGDDLFVQGVVD